LADAVDGKSRSAPHGRCTLRFTRLR